MGEICKKLHIPALFGMILAGVFIGPFGWNLISDDVLSMSSELRRIALVIILIRAGLKLSFADLKRVGRPAVLMCFVPAMFEIFGMYLLAPAILSISRLEALVLGAVIAAVSPAVIVPKMIKLIDEGYGTKQGIPQMILAGASVDDVFVIVMFTSFTGLLKGKELNVMGFVNIPISIILGIFVGLLAGMLFLCIIKLVRMRDTMKTMILLSGAFLLLTLEDAIKNVVPFAALLSIMFMGVWIFGKDEKIAKRLAAKFDRMWVASEIVLFVLVGASVSLDHVFMAGASVLVLLLGVLVFRMIGVFICFLGSKVSMKERFFCMLAYTPKATVQAAIGGLPLAMGFACGNVVLTVSVIAILFTAPIGAFMIDLTYKHFLHK